PEISLVAILDADKEGFLRSETSLVQPIGRAARNAEGHVIMYADNMTDSMRRAISETERRRAIQEAYNKAHGITPTTIKKAVRDLIAISRVLEDENKGIQMDIESMSKMEIDKMIRELSKKMRAFAAELNFEDAAKCRDKIAELREALEKNH
ncbi:MAG: UvrB/UvrC motif-containing protein, partial [Oribacterium parvum]|uniref:UvrB/UvrC motif-containing protein n=1 Tax=Oribacterium parvum TaxID=1501329 RepID=UPI001CADA14F